MNREKNIAVCLSSYKRFSDLHRQIYAMMSQSYPRLHLYVAVKGMTEYAFRKILMKQFQSFIDAGRLTLRLFPNKNQLSNFMDAIRDVDVSAYDLFVKIDDDDYYSPDYVQMINSFHDTIPDDHSSYFQDAHWVRYENEGFTNLSRGYYGDFGATIVLSRSALEVVRACELHPDKIGELVPEAVNNQYGFREDNLMHKIMRPLGCHNIAEFLREKGMEYHMIYQRANASVMRGGIVSSEFWKKNLAITLDPSRFEHILELRHPHWSDQFCVQGESGHRISQSKAQARIISFTEDEIILKWDNYGQERFVKNEESLYVCELPQPV